MTRLTCAAAVLMVACANSANPVVDANAEEQAIRMQNQQWSQAAQRKDVAAILTFYASDATAAFPDQPPVTGTDGLRELWQKDLATPGLLDLSWTVDKIDVAAAGDMATDFGRVFSKWQSSDGAVVTSTDKYLTVWKKVNGVWKVYYDTWNTNAPVK